MTSAVLMIGWTMSGLMAFEIRQPGGRYEGVPQVSP
jgi:hypothetical protein